MTATDAPEPARRRGRPAILDRNRIIAAARSLDPATLTMKAVADKLGVDRKALNYHVTDRESLLRLVASDALEADLAERQSPADADWRVASRHFATLMRDSLISLGTLAQYTRFDGDRESGLRALRPAEELLEVLLNAGFTDEDAGRGLAFLAEFASISARNALLVQETGTHPQGGEIRRVLGSDAGDFYALQRYTNTDWEPFGEPQFTFGLELFEAGMNQRRQPPSG